MVSDTIIEKSKPLDQQWYITGRMSAIYPQYISSIAQTMLDTYHE